MQSNSKFHNWSLHVSSWKNTSPPYNFVLLWIERDKKGGFVVTKLQICSSPILWRRILSTICSSPILWPRRILSLQFAHNPILRWRRRILSLQFLLMTHIMFCDEKEFFFFFFFFFLVLVMQFSKIWSSWTRFCWENFDMNANFVCCNLWWRNFSTSPLMIWWLSPAHSWSAWFKSMLLLGVEETKFHVFSGSYYLLFDYAIATAAAAAAGWSGRTGLAWKVSNTIYYILCCCCHHCSTHDKIWILQITSSLQFASSSK